MRQKLLCILWQHSITIWIYLILKVKCFLILMRNGHHHIYYSIDYCILIYPALVKRALVVWDSLFNGELNDESNIILAHLIWFYCVSGALFKWLSIVLSFDLWCWPKRMHNLAFVRNEFTRRHCHQIWHSLLHAVKHSFPERLLTALLDVYSFKPSVLLVYICLASNSKLIRFP